MIHMDPPLARVTQRNNQQFGVKSIATYLLETISSKSNDRSLQNIFCQMHHMYIFIKLFLFYVLV